MNAKHTPGPWVVDSGEALSVRAPHGGIVAQLHHLKGRHGMGGRLPDGEAVANAHLVAAAPELLEACQTIAEWLRREDEGFPDAAERRKTSEGEAEWHEWWVETLRLCSLAQTQALAAIAKATGEQA